MMVLVVSLDDHDTSFQTEQTAMSVSAMTIRLEQAIRGNINRIASTNRILGSPKRVSRCCGFDLGYGVRSNFEIDAR